MTEAQYARRRRHIARRAKHLEQPQEIDPEAVDELAAHYARASAHAGAQWVVYRGAAEARYGRPFWRGGW